MKTYLVGGAIRDQLLGLPVQEKDWVVVGATVNDMLKAGFRQVGKDFPVFLHPQTKEEYALARIERKIGRGYTGFEFDASAVVTLEEDLKRRDITINAMAQTAAGQIIDPHHGQDDLAKKILRHVSPAFVEDPVRVLRVARFAARFGFEVAPETIALMRLMVERGEIDALVAERVWKELERALLEKYPEKFFAVLAACHALPVLFPNLKIPGMVALMQASQHSSFGPVRFAALFHQLNPTELKSLCDRYRVPSEYRDLTLLVIKYLLQYQRSRELSPNELLNLLLAVDAFRRETRFKDFLSACESCSMDSTSNWLEACYQAAKTIDVKEIPSELQGKAIAEKINALRCTAIYQWLQKSARA